MDEKVKQMVEEIIEKSRKGGVIWKSTFDLRFRVDFPVGYIVISHEISIHGVYEIEVCKDDGLYIFHKFVKEDEKADFGLMRELYKVASAKRHNSETVLENMLKNIKSNYITRFNPEDKAS
jgi:hypothetical protein